MKKLVFLFTLLTTVATQAQTIDKQTFIYSIKGVDTLRLDRYTAPSASSAQKPCLMFVFGGGFVSGARDKDHYRSYLEYYAQKGFVVVSIDYRLGLKMALERGPIDEQNFPMAFIGTLTMATEDLYDATNFLLSNADAWNMDKNKIIASGSSAGAITVLLGEYYICNDGILAKKLPAAFNYAGVISFAGAIFGEGDRLQWKKKPTPIMLFHGDADRNVPYDAITYGGMAGFFGSKYIATQLTEAQIPHYFYAVTNTDHAMAVSPLDNNRYEIDAFLEKLVFGGQQLIINTYVNPLDKPEIPKVFTISDYIQSNFN